MTRFLALLIIALLIYLALGSLARAARRSLVGRQIETLWGSLRREGGEGTEHSAPVELVRCRSCGVHVPRGSTRTGPEGHMCQRCSSRMRSA